MSEDPLTTADVVIVGAGLSGAVVAERMANVLNKNVVILDKRDHIGGNCHDYIDSVTGIRVSQYGPHLFHTNDEGVWEYVNRFCKWNRYDHSVVAVVPEVGIVPLPVNINTLNAFGQNIKDAEEARAYLDANTTKFDNPSNGEEACLTRFPEAIYKSIFQPYTTKQWERDPKDLAPSVLQRIPLRLDFDNRYFSDRYQALPEEGYTSMFETMLDSPRICTMLSTDYFTVQHRIKPGTPIIFTGPIDRFFEARGLPPLEYRSLRFELVRHMDQPGFVQTHGVVNYPASDVPYTRETEYKHFYGESRRSSHSLTVKEFPSAHGEPYYPVVNEHNMALFAKYKDMAEQEETDNNVHFLGRLAGFKYVNMDQAIRHALDFFRDKFESATTT